ncbi:MAG: hypothetical protein A3G24_08000 [Betaproteobacteria bacterium RIFCSPLOWO2_12_FULL_62_13]|nr:MAG: hypothetical protein A3G24_08000 [Betaproteobacteria bacterium RIFCSPLOWO2_12_FULL_62_13]
MTPELQGKTVLVTGAARGIGACIATHFAEHGCHVVVSDIDFDAACIHAQRLGANATAMRMDVRDRQEVRSTLQRIVQEQGGIDVLINNAGLMTFGPCVDTSDEQWDDLIAVNLTGIFNCVQAVSPTMIDQGSGCIINLASVAAAKGGGAFGNVWYGASKAAVVALTKGLARELGAHGIRVNAIAPSVVETDMVKKFLTPDVRQRLLTRFPLGRLATVDDVANLAIFLASNLSSFVTGETIAVDGGFLKI